MWLLKQADQAMLAIRSEFPEATEEARMNSIVAIGHVVQHVLTRDPPFSDIHIHHIASIIQARLKDFDSSLNLCLGTLASELLAETGLDILSFEGMISPPELQESMGRVLRPLVAHLGRQAADQVLHLYTADPEEMARYADSLETVTGRYEAAITRLGFDLHAAMPSWSSFLRPNERQTSAGRVLRELDIFEADIVSWAILLNHPRLIRMAVPRFALMRLIGECYHGTDNRAERTCANLKLLKVLFRHMIERDLADLSDNERSGLDEALRGKWNGNLDPEPIKMEIERFEELPSRYSFELDDGPLTDFPVDSAVFVRIKTWLKTFMHYEDSVEGLASLRMNFVEAIRASINRLTPSQLAWLDNYIRDGLYGQSGRFFRGSVVESAAELAYELARVCQIKLFDFIPADSMPGAEHIRSIVSNLIFTKRGNLNRSTHPVLRYATDPNLTPEQRALYADAWRTFTVAHKSFELRPLGSLGRETAVAGFLLNSFREHPEQFLKLLTEYKMTFFAPRRLRLSSRLPPDVTDIIGLLASPTERITPLVIRIDSVYRQHAQRVGELLQEAQRVRETGQEAADFIPEPNECFDVGRLVGAIK